MPLTVECKKRPEGSKPNALRRSGLLPANLYGHNGNESVSLVIETRTVETLLRKARVNDTPIQLKVTDGEWVGNAVIKEVQTHPAKGTLYHLSFYSLAKG